MSRKRTHCATCGEPYVQKDREQYCSTECRGAKKRKDWPVFRCLACGDPFSVTPSRAKTTSPKYCSRQCKYAHFKVEYRTQITKECPVCGTSFQTKRSADSTCCSYTCMGVLKERKETRSCATCGDDFIAKKSAYDICCSWECRVERLRGENHPSWRGGQLPNYAGDWVRARRKARDRDGNICQECGKTPEENGANMSVHHIRPYRAFDDPHEANRLENLISLCVGCHSKKPE